MGSSWAALAEEEDFQGRGLSRERDRNSTDRSGSRMRGRGAGERGGVGAGVLKSENNGRIRWQPSLIERLS